MATRRALVWFKSTDLRLADNPVLHAAHAENDAVSHLFVFDPFWFGKSRRGYPKCGYHRAKFLLESVADLRKVSAQRMCAWLHDVSCCPASPSSFLSCSFARHTCACALISHAYLAIPFAEFASSWLQLDCSHRTCSRHCSGGCMCPSDCGSPIGHVSLRTTVSGAGTADRRVHHGRGVRRGAPD